MFCILREKSWNQIHEQAFAFFSFSPQRYLAPSDRVEDEDSKGSGTTASAAWAEGLFQGVVIYLSHFPEQVLCLRDVVEKRIGSHGERVLLRYHENRVSLTGMRRIYPVWYSVQEEVLV